MPIKDMVRLSEAVEATGLARDTLRGRCAKGAIKGAVLDGKNWYIPVAALPGIKRRRARSGAPALPTPADWTDGQDMPARRS